MHPPIPLDIVRLIVDNLDDRHRWRNLPSKERLVKLEEWRRVGWALALSCRELNELGTRMVWRSVRATSKNALAVVAALASSKFLRNCVEEIDIQIRNSRRKDGAIMRFLRSIVEADPATSLFRTLPALPRLRYLSFSANTDEARQNWGPIRLSPRLILTHVTLSFDAPLTDHEPFFLRTVLTKIKVASLRSLDLTVNEEGAKSAILAFLPSCTNLEVLLLTFGVKALFRFIERLPPILQSSMRNLRFLSIIPRGEDTFMPFSLSALIQSLPPSLIACRIYQPDFASTHPQDLCRELQKREPSSLKAYIWTQRDLGPVFEETVAVKEVGRWHASRHWVGRHVKGLFDEILIEGAVS